MRRFAYVIMSVVFSICVFVSIGISINDRMSCYINFWPLQIMQPRAASATPALNDEMTSGNFDSIFQYQLCYWKYGKWEMCDIGWAIYNLVDSFSVLVLTELRLKSQLWSQFIMEFKPAGNWHMKVVTYLRRCFIGLWILYLSKLYTFSKFFPKLVSYLWSLLGRDIIRKYITTFLISVIGENVSLSSSRGWFVKGSYVSRTFERMLQRVKTHQ